MCGNFGLFLIAKKRRGGFSSAMFCREGSWLFEYIAVGREVVNSITGSKAIEYY